MKYTRKFWRRYVAFAGLIGGASLAIDVPLHAWPQLGIATAATGTTLLFARRGFKAAGERMEREAQRPDYAKIARLEVELGLVPPPPEPDPQMFRPVNAIIHNSPARPVNVHRLAYTKPDVRCAFCIPGRQPVAPNFCPFYPGCQS